MRKEEKKLHNNDFVDMMVKKAYSTDPKIEPYKPTITSKKDQKVEPYIPRVTTKKDEQITPYKNALNIEEIESLTEELKSNLVKKQQK